MSDLTQGQMPFPQNPEVILDEQREWLRVTLGSIGDAVITTDAMGLITFLNPVAQALTGWTPDEAAGLPIEEVFRIVSEATLKTVESPTVRALRDGVVVGLRNHTLLIDKRGVEHPVDDSGAPIRNKAGVVAGVVLVFRDITEWRRHELSVQNALAYAEDIVSHIDIPLVILEAGQRIRSANSAFYDEFRVTREDTEGQLLGVLGSAQWNNGLLHELLNRVFEEDHQFEKFEYQSTFPEIGLRIMSLTARRLSARMDRPVLVLLSIDDITDRKNANASMK